MLEQVFLLTLSLIELTEQSEYLTIGKLFKNNITFCSKYILYYAHKKCFYK